MKRIVWLSSSRLTGGCLSVAMSLLASGTAMAEMPEAPLITSVVGNLGVTGNLQTVKVEDQEVAGLPYNVYEVSLRGELVIIAMLPSSFQYVVNSNLSREDAGGALFSSPMGRVVGTSYIVEYTANYDDGGHKAIFEILDYKGKISDGYDKDELTYGIELALYTCILTNFFEIDCYFLSNEDW